MAVLITSADGEAKLFGASNLYVALTGGPMQNRWRLVISTVAVVALVNLVPAAGQSPRSAAKNIDAAWTPPRTPDGQPDINGIWTNYDATPFEAPDPEDAARLTALRQWFPPNDPTGARDFGAADGPGSAPRNARRKAMVVDPESGRVPVRPEAAAKKDEALAHLTDSWENHTPWERCITRGVPGGIFPGLYGAGYHIVQAPGVVVIRYEMIHEARIIPVDGRPHLPSSIRLWNGDSRGHWEGNTLVVDITNYNDKSSIATNIASQAMRGIGQSEQLHVVERFTIVDANTINYEVTIDDPKIYTRPWKIAMPIHRDPQYQIFEYACHEGNYGLPNTLSGARAQDKAAAAAVQPK
jgi:hypothetical protein